jgi:3-methyladenine DNA glycosylase AlkD
VPADAPLVESVRAALADAGDPTVAVGQQAYMKSSMPFHGPPAQRLRAVLRPFLRSYLPPDRASHEATVLALWDDATHREERYAALAFARHRRAARWLDVPALDLHRHLVVTGAWWDLVDEVASHLVGSVVAAQREGATPVMRAWATDADLWVRRTSVICQLRHQADTDVDLLRHAIEANLDDTSFWLRKAIGWALRQYARTDPDWVPAEVDRLGPRLSSLSRREALKHLPATR